MAKNTYTKLNKPRKPQKSRVKSISQRNRYIILDLETNKNYTSLNGLAKDKGNLDVDILRYYIDFKKREQVVQTKHAHFFLRIIFAGEEMI